MASTSAPKKTQGRRKIPLAFIENESNRLVTFSKRRAGLAKKVSELCTLCGVKALLIIFSPAEKIYSFGHPSVDALIARYMDEINFEANLPENQTSGDPQDELIKNLNAELTSVKDQIDSKNIVTGQILDVRKTMSQDKLIYIAPVDTIALPEIKQHRESLHTLLKNACALRERLNPTPINPNPNFNQNFMPQPMYYPQNRMAPAFVDLAQTGMAGTDNNQPLYMPSAPPQVFYDQSFTMRPPGYEMQPYYHGNFSYLPYMPTPMNAGFNNTNMVQPIQETAYVNQGPFTGNQGTPNANQGLFTGNQGTPNAYQGPFSGNQGTANANEGPFTGNQGTVNTYEGPFTGNQAIAPSTGIDPVTGVTGNFQTFTQMLMGDDFDETPPVFNPLNVPVFHPGPPPVFNPLDLPRFRPGQGPN